LLGFFKRELILAITLKLLVNAESPRFKVKVIQQKANYL
jgi:hypothetical protein